MLNIKKSDLVKVLLFLCMKKEKSQSALKNTNFSVTESHKARELLL